MEALEVWESQKYPRENLFAHLGWTLKSQLMALTLLTLKNSDHDSTVLTHGQRMHQINLLDHCNIEGYSGKEHSMIECNEHL